MKYEDKEKIEKGNGICNDIKEIDDRYTELESLSNDKRLKSASCNMSFSPDRLFPAIQPETSQFIKKEMILKGYKLLLDSIRNDLEAELEKL